jgi:VIT1/CCC1 family predicted Fe2+/Mn2+ transporter
LQQVTSVQIERTRLERDDVLGALASFVLVFATSLPAAFPFFFLRDPMLALRVSNLLLIVMLFVVGWWWAGYSHGSRIGTGLTMMSIGVVLVLVAKALGG